MKIIQANSPEGSFIAQEEKKRKKEAELSSPASQKSPPPQPMITLVPTGSSPLSMPVGMVTASHPVFSVSGAGNPKQIILAPTTAGQPTIIHNGLPMFQLVNSQSLATSQPAQFVAFAQSHGRSLITSSPSLFSQKAVPVLFQPVQLQTSVKSCVAGSPQQIMTTPTKQGTSIATPVLGNQQLLVSTTMHSAPKPQHSVLKQTLNNKPVIPIGNSQVLESNKQTSKEISSVPNGLYPVTPPKTPEDQRSESGSQDMTEDNEVSIKTHTTLYSKTQRRNSQSLELLKFGYVVTYDLSTCICTNKFVQVICNLTKFVKFYFLTLTVIVNRSISLS